jgi:hypothetical protein
MLTQLAFDFAFPLRPAVPVIQTEEWLDITDIARGVGFTSPVEISAALNDALESHQDEPEEAYDQRLYDCLWLAHLQWTFFPGEAAALNCFFERAPVNEERRMRIRLELWEKIIRPGLPGSYPGRMGFKESD